MDEILPNEKKVCATNHKAPKFLDSYHNANDLYQVDRVSIEETKEKLD